ncbi:FAD-binding and (Fe-S)-binding domain-containing protein [Mobilicoccus pelagius]|uniref:Putative FAD-linked oxidase n=1 Tax=Mobilicoccus pelagius NBRC 104925 TaxID=1089455 RepID=H5UVG8_9MICO|nr:putative FAD-linked oxidase [Mobilicoccus pelagius NBRC 104925]
MPGLRTDAATRAAYVSDASIYRRVPEGVVEPRSASVVADAVRWARAQGLSVTSRGGGTSVAGNAIGTGLVVDTSRHLTGIAIDPARRSATVEPGVVCDALRVAAGEHGLTYGPDPSTHSRCTIGGMVGNNACGSHSVAWGTSAENLVALRMVLADGREVEATRGSCSDPRIEAELRVLVEENEELIRRELGRFPRQVSGYGLHYLLPEHGFDVAKALAGSEGTCGVFTQLTVALVAPPAATVLVVLGYEDAFLAAADAARLRLPGVTTIEGMGSDLVAALRTRPGQETAGSTLPAGGAWLYCEVGGDTPEEAVARAEDLVAAATVAGPDSLRVVTDRAETRTLWGIREAAAGIATRRADGGEAWPGWEDSAVPAEHLADYLRDLYALMARLGLTGIPFGHFGEGCIHVRIDFELGTEAGVARYREFIEAAADLVATYGGSVSGEHGDGRARSELLSRMYSPEMLALFARFKAIFDPENALNPGVLVDPEPIDAGVRPGPGIRTNVVIPVHALSRDGGDVASAVNRCVGVGACRSDAGAMCPSYHATRDEVHTTRGRARVLAEMLRGEFLDDGWRSEAAREALDLCLSCKACATECPVNVDMATYKAEFLHEHYRGRIRPLAHYSMGWLPLAAAAVTSLRLGGLVNRITSIRPLEVAVMKAAGVESRRRMISFAEQLPFTGWFAERRRRGEAPQRPADAARETLVLWPDTFTNHLSPHVGVAAVEVLEALGYDVVVPDGRVCCGLTWHSTGQLDVTKAVLRHTLDVLEPHLAAGRRVVGLEPSCTVMLTEAHELLPDDPRAEQLAELVATLAEVVAPHAADAGSRWPFARLDAAAVAQVHCHLKAKGSYDPDRVVLRRLGVDLDEVGGGCCGLAGNFGFEPGHYEVSTACAERELFPKVGCCEDDDLVLADGFSCRTQIEQGTGRSGLHLAEVLRRALR